MKSNETETRKSSIVQKLTGPKRKLRPLIAFLASAGTLAMAVLAYASSSTQVEQLAPLAVPRTAHTATVLADGSVLITGGRDAAGTALAVAEIFDPKTRTSKAIGDLVTARTGHTATLLKDGRVLVAGGTNATGTLASAEIFEPLAPSSGFHALDGAMGAPRTRHTATLLNDGKVLLAGGDSAGSAELFDPATETFSVTLLSMAEPRSGHTATLFSDNTVLLAGGQTDSIETFNAADQTFTLEPQRMTDVRISHEAIALSDTRLLFFGGDAANTIDEWNFTTDTLALKASMDAPASSATLLANGNILVLRSDVAGIYAPDAADQNSAFTAFDQLSTPGSGTLARRGQTATELPDDKRILVAGGVNADNDLVRPVALFNPARIWTDKDDYYPEETVLLNGSGWKSNEDIYLFVVDSATDQWTYKSTEKANANGNFAVDPYFIVEQRHLGVTFDLTAYGAESTMQADVRFTDAAKVGSVTVSAQTTPYPLSGITAPDVTYTITVARVSGSSGGINADLRVTSPLPSGVTASFSPNPLVLPNGVNSNTATLTIKRLATTPAGTTLFTVQAQNGTGNDSETGGGSLRIDSGVTNTTVSAVSGSGSYGGTATLTATLKAGGSNLSGKSVTFTKNGTSAGSATTDSNGVATLSDVSLTGINAGTYAGAVGASFTADSSYSASSATGTLTVTAKHITGTFTADNKAYDGNDSATVLTRALVGAISGDVVSLTGGTATFSDKNVGNGKTVTLAGATLSGAGAGNYVLDSVGTATANITARHITGTFTADNKAYDGNNSATVLTRSLVGAISGDLVSLTGGTATFSDKNVGNGKTVTLASATLSGANAGNYVLDSVGTTSANITAKHITGSFTADNKEYDGNNSATVLTRSLVGEISGDAVSLTGGTATFSDKNPGIGKTVTLTGASLGGTDVGNYVLDSVATTTANITAKQITGSFTAKEKEYDGNDSATVLTRSLLGAIGSEDVSLTGGTATFSDKNVGVGKTVTLAGATLSGTDAGNYTLGSVGTTTANITALDITGTFTADDKVYDGNASATVLTRSLIGAISGDVVSLTNGTASFNDKNVGGGKTVTLSGASLSGADAGNYVLVSVGTTTASITALDITGSFTADDKIYNGNASATVLTRSLIGAISGDAVSLTGGTASFNDKNVGTGKTVTLSGAGLGGADAGNYVLVSVGTTTASITALDITGSFTADDKVYNGNASATVLMRSLIGAISGDAVSLTNGTASFNDKNVGNGKTVTLSGASLGGADADNYVLISVGTTTASITALDITGSFTADNKVYDGDASATVLMRSLIGAISGDAVSLTGGTASFNDKNVGTGKTVILSGAGLGGTDSGNYVLVSVGTTTANITALDITGSFTANDKVYNGDPSATVLMRSLIGVISGDAVSLTGGTATFSDKNVGMGKTVTLSGASLGGADAGNYMLASVGTTTANITALEITGSFTADNKVYDGNNSASVLTGSLLGVISPDVVTLTGGTAAFDDKNVGMGKTVTLSGASLGGADAGNYVLGSVGDTTANITALHVTGTFTATSKTYDGSNAAAVVTRALVGAVTGDAVSLTSGTATFDNKNIGMGKTVTLTGAILSDTDAGNYVLDSVATTTANITALHITGTFTAGSKTYDGNAAAAVLTRSLLGVIGMEDVSLTGGTASFNDKTVGMGKTVTLTGASLGGTDIGNYVLDSVATTNANITSLHITGSFTADNKVYDGNNSASVVTRSLIGAISGDVVALMGGTATFSDKNVGMGKTVILTGASLSGTDAGNYVLDSVATATANNSRASAMFTVTPYTVTYDGQPHTATVSSITGVNGENGPDVGTVNVSNTIHTDAGTYSTDFWTFSGTANYNDIAATTITDKINKAEQTITWANPANITFGTPLSGTQLNATVAGVSGGSAPGALTYTPPAGTVLGVGATQLKVDAAATINYNAASKMVSINVNYSFLGFLPPIDNLPVINSVKAGQTIPVKWQLKDAAGNLISDLGSLAPMGLTSVKVNCSSGLVDAVEEVLLSPGSTVFRFDGTQFIYNWQTSKSWIGTCRLMTVTLKDGTKYSAQFTFK